MNRQNFLFLITISFIFFIFSCEKSKDYVKDFSIKTDSVYIENDELVVKGIIDNGDHTITDYGHCWSTTPNPDLKSEKISLGNSSESKKFANVLKNLKEVTYYVKAYASNGTTVKYGEEKKILFLKAGSVLDKEGNIYHTIKIGKQIWFKENVRSTRYASGEIIQGIYTYGNIDENAEKYGRLYIWDAVMHYSQQEKGQGLCPQGWHIPSEAEWNELINYLGGENISGGKLKSMSADFWNAPNTGADDAFGFSALGTGKKSNNVFSGLGNTAYYWTSTQSIANQSQASGFLLTNNDSKISKITEWKSDAFSVRCIKNSN